MAKKEEKIKNQDSKKENKNKKSFFKSFKAELKKVVWPTPKQLVNNTAAVLAIVLLTSIIVFALDFVFETINKSSVGLVKSIVQTNESNENTTEGSEENNTTEGTDTTENTESTDITGNTEGAEPAEIVTENGNTEGQTENTSEEVQNQENNQ